MRDMEKRWQVIEPLSRCLPSERRNVKAFVTLAEAEDYIAAENMKGVYKIRGIMPKKNKVSNYIEEMVLLPEINLEDE